MDSNGTDWSDNGCFIIEKEREMGFTRFEGDKCLLADDPNDDGPVVISSPFPFIGGKPRTVSLGETSVYSISIQNTTSEPVELWGVNIYCSNPADTFTLSILEPPSIRSNLEYIQSFLEGFSLEDRVLQPHHNLNVWLSCKPKKIGLHTSIVHFDVGDDRIERIVFLLAEDREAKCLASERQLARHTKLSKKFGSNYEYAVVASDSYSKRKAKGVTCKLPLFEIPLEVRKVVENKLVPEVIRKGLTKENYASYFSTLLNMEELCLENATSCHNVKNATLRRKKADLFVLSVPGLAERRPSLVHGDLISAVLASESANDTRHSHQGTIYCIEADQVVLKFRREFCMNFQTEDSYDIRFMYNRASVRRSYQAVHSAQQLSTDILFPTRMTKRSVKATGIVPFTHLNEEQLQAVEMILGCEGCPPYVIHGPPGTGKTMTLVEAILQLYTTRKDTHIAVCAASNSSADHILEKLVNDPVIRVKEHEIFRLNASSRSYEDVLQGNNIRFSFFEDYVFKCPPLEALVRYRVIISTYSSSSLLHSEGIPRGHFSHIFLDEAGQASEPETMIPISSLCQKETVVVLAGDPMQLGPVVYSKEAMEFGLGKSYLERLFEYNCYEAGDQNRSYITKLVRNYRCHPAILHLPSKLFYDGKLLACKEETSCIKSWLSLVPNKKYPVLFIGIEGYDEREGNDPSWFNLIEVNKVVQTVKKLISRGLSEDDIGIIAPYRKQVIKIAKALESYEIMGIKVGSVEQFQGQEKEVIFVSTVRSTDKHNVFDKTHCLGFLSNPRRFNVAVTRAKSLLIIVGNPHTVSKDLYWNKLLWQCVEHNSYEGCLLPEWQYEEESDEEQEKLTSNN